ncbi:hypothetical protein [Mycetocola zhadangensis]|uniref:Uncharacterized protein n=1 Tax=Mycetocola zhadangensis TaxID=1164595 RepID=A0A3L7J6C4_9MICO|nr:hypothetical protein [Mycetocola zhadangensis]RLQ85915.1 hypothetical protein D9V28_03425 [Mycetocola zhadangensis]GGE86885.1 hypothetical protein GCM10011313_06720 [Mycetocola zhadangensis]
MNNTFALTDPLALADLTVYLSRVRLVDDTAVRVIAGGGVLAVYSAVLAPRGLLDRSPTVLGLRTFAETSGANFDRVIAPASLSDRIAKIESDGAGVLEISLPDSDVSASWAGISPPRGGWGRVGELSGVALELAARDGAGEVARAIPANTGDMIVQRVRSDVWSRPLTGFDAVPAGVAFAAASLGFLAGEEEVPLFASGQWLRASTYRGHVLARSLVV